MKNRFQLALVGAALALTMPSMAISDPLYQFQQVAGDPFQPNTYFEVNLEATCGANDYVIRGQLVQGPTPGFGIFAKFPGDETVVPAGDVARLLADRCSA